HVGARMDLGSFREARSRMDSGRTRRRKVPAYDTQEGQTRVADHQHSAAGRRRGDGLGLTRQDDARARTGNQLSGFGLGPVAEYERALIPRLADRRDRVDFTVRRPMDPQDGRAEKLE